MTLTSTEGIDPATVIHTPKGREVEYRVVYETEMRGWDSPFMLDMGFLPNPSAKYKIRIEVEQIAEGAA